MSAYLVNRYHIGAIVAVAIHGPSGIRTSTWHAPYWSEDTFEADAYQHGPARLEDRVALGRMLWDANARSVAYRFPDAPGMIAAWADTRAELDTPASYPFPTHLPTAVEALKLADCLEYQSCEPADWDQSCAARFLDAFRAALIRTLPGYASAPWEWAPPADPDPTAKVDRAMASALQLVKAHVNGAHPALQTPGCPVCNTATAKGI